MVVILLLGILTAAIVPSMRGTFEGQLLHAQTRRFVGAVDLAYSRAVTLGQPHRIRLITNENRFFVEARVPGPEGRATFAPVPYSPGAQGEIDPRIAITSAPPDAPEDLNPEIRTSGSAEAEALRGVDAPITFYPDGTADEVILVLQDRQGFRQALHIHRATARVRIRPLPSQ
jgi:type II secretory pathway pseudopilin PulG